MGVEGVNLDDVALRIDLKVSDPSFVIAMEVTVLVGGWEGVATVYGSANAGNS